MPGADKAQVDAWRRELCKADLVSGMVGEFPELQGIMGRYYALHEKLPAAVADAIGDHYAPAGPNDRCPSAPVSIAVALADKLDTLTSLLSIGEKPTGSRDPYALRRAALGVIRIVVENKLRLPLAHVLQGSRPARLLRRPPEGAAAREGRAARPGRCGVRAGRQDDLVRLLARVEALQSFLGTEDGKNLLTATGAPPTSCAPRRRRTRRLPRRIAGAPDVALLEQAEEKAVASRLARRSSAR